MQLTRRHYLNLLAASLTAAPRDTLLSKWRETAAASDGVLGAAALHLSSGRLVSLHGAERFPLASVCKLPIAMHILALVDEGKLSRQSGIEVVKQDVTLNNSEIGHRWPRERRFPLDELLLAMIAHSDNTAVETLYRIGGGAPAIAARLRAWRVEGVRIDRTERQCNRDAAASMRAFLADPRDTATPDGTVRMLSLLFRGLLLSAPSTARMVEMLQATTTGPGRIKGLLPPGTVVAHKTGTTGTYHGLNGSTNDVGVVTLPGNGGQLALAIYLKGSTSDLPTRESTIARIAKAACGAGS
ncbi:MAG: class A beta-lactamase [Bryobacteraceae bacterium]